MKEVPKRLVQKVVMYETMLVFYIKSSGYRTIGDDYMDRLETNNRNSS